MPSAQQHAMGCYGITASNDGNTKHPYVHSLQYVCKFGLCHGQLVVILLPVPL